MRSLRILDERVMKHTGMVPGLIYAARNVGPIDTSLLNEVIVAYNQTVNNADLTLADAVASSVNLNNRVVSFIHSLWSGNNPKAKILAYYLEKDFHEVSSALFASRLEYNYRAYLYNLCLNFPCVKPIAEFYGIKELPVFMEQ